MSNHRDRLQIGAFAELVGLSIPQLRRYDRLSLLAPAGRSSAGYRYYSSGQTGAARVIALLRSIDMPIADVRRIVSGADDAQRQQIFIDHRARLEARLFVPWTGEGLPPPQSFYVYVDDPEMVCAEFEQAGANILDSVALRPYGMRDFPCSTPTDIVSRSGAATRRCATWPTSTVWIATRSPSTRHGSSDANPTDLEPGASGAVKIGEGQTGFAPQDYALPIGGAARCGPSRGVHECHIAPDPGQLAALDARPDWCGLVAPRSAGERAAKPACPCYTISVECPVWI